MGGVWGWVTCQLDETPPENKDIWAVRKCIPVGAQEGPVELLTIAGVLCLSSMINQGFFQFQMV